MGDRGGTATLAEVAHQVAHYTRWEIGGEPQPEALLALASPDYTRWEIGGEPQRCCSCAVLERYYTRWEIGGEPQLLLRCLLLWLIGFSALERAVWRTPRCRPFFELAGGRRLSTLTEDNLLLCHGFGMVDYTRWEIGGEPQRQRLPAPTPSIIPDGRSGGNRNSVAAILAPIILYPMGDRGGTAT